MPWQLYTQPVIIICYYSRLCRFIITSSAFSTGMHTICVKTTQIGAVKLVFLTKNSQKSPDLINRE